MPGSFIVTLDTTGPQGVALTLDTGNPAWSTDSVVDALATTTDADTTGYQIKFWGDVAGVPDEATAVWQNYTADIQVTLTAGDGAKTVYCRMRDDVLNTSSVASDSITVDTTAPVVTIISGPTPTKISEQATKNTSTLQWKADSDIQAYKVMYVPSANALQNDPGNAQIPTTAGSSNVQGAAAAGATLIAANTTTTTTITGTDLKTASTGDAQKNLKVFVQDLAGNWSVL